MKRVYVVAGMLVVAIVLVGLAAVYVLAVQQQVSGNVNSDTTWGGVINMEANVTVSNGATLTIQPGTTVNLGSSTLQIDGTLVAKGNWVQKISFNQGKILFTANSTPWNEQTGLGSIMDNCISSSYIILRESSPKLTNSVLNDPPYDARIILIDGGAPIISNNQIIGDVHPVVYGIGGGNGIDFWNDSNATITGNTIKNCMNGISISAKIDTFTGTITIEHNLITENGVCGLYFGVPQKVIFQDNTVTKNYWGFRVDGYSNQSVFENNNIYGNTNRTITMEASRWNTDMNIPNNWWGTTDNNAITQSIYDSKSNPQLGTVSFTPILEAPNPNAPKA